MIKPPSSQQDRGCCALLGLLIYLMCCGLTRSPQVSRWCLYNHIYALCFLAERRTDSVCGSALKPDKQDLGLQSCSLFSELVFQVSESVGTADILDDPSAERRLNWVSAMQKKNKRWHFTFFSKKSASNLLLLLCPLLSEEIWARFEEEDLYRGDLITYIEATWKALCIFSSFMLTIVGSKLETMATL